ncbi:TetR/AcrR family transcriptional regulator [Glycomyces paridis]|uniref:TetR family transcriptional regulator n=1 Tax=Glycomyces paridis TaxID=2126555 RepID=A0A4V4HMA7_9ACTN|nr:TetR family transcriptional regulator [Glycomyces paridis]THV21236.1 TetR family transcriptional regulator [Glycomyces paridis]
MTGTTRAARVAATRETILSAAERLFAEHGVAAVSGRQISEAAGQGNNTAVGYHFGAKADLVRAIVLRHREPIERLRVARIAAVGATGGLRDWVECFVLPTMDHLGSLGDPTWFARFAAQVLTDPGLRPIVEEEAFAASSLRHVKSGLDRCLADLPPRVRAERDEMVRELMIIVPAVRESALAAGAPTARATWHDAGAGLVDAIVGLYLADVTA